MSLSFFTANSALFSSVFDRVRSCFRRYIPPRDMRATPHRNGEIRWLNVLLLCLDFSSFVASFTAFVAARFTTIGTSSATTFTEGTEETLRTTRSQAPSPLSRRVNRRELRSKLLMLFDSLFG